MKYRAVVVGLTVDGHPVQTFSQHESVVREWADKMAVKHNTSVQIFFNEERLLETVTPPRVVKGLSVI